MARKQVTDEEHDTPPRPTRGRRSAAPTDEPQPGNAVVPTGAEAEAQDPLPAESPKGQAPEPTETVTSQEDDGRRVTVRTVRRTTRRTEQTTDEDITETVTETGTAAMPEPYRPPAATDHPVPVG